MYRRDRRGGEHYLVVRLRDGSLAQMPSWMTDPSRCGGMTLVSSPVCSLSALRALRDLLRALKGNGAPASEVDKRIPAPGVRRSGEQGRPAKAVPVRRQPKGLGVDAAGSAQQGRGIAPANVSGMVQGGTGAGGGPR